MIWPYLIIGNACFFISIGITYDLTRHYPWASFGTQLTTVLVLTIGLGGSIGALWNRYSTPVTAEASKAQVAFAPADTDPSIHDMSAGELRFKDRNGNVRVRAGLTGKWPVNFEVYSLSDNSVTVLTITERGSISTESHRMPGTENPK